MTIQAYNLLKTCNVNAEVIRGIFIYVSLNLSYLVGKTVQICDQKYG